MREPPPRPRADRRCAGALDGFAHPSRRYRARGRRSARPGGEHRRRDAELLGRLTLKMLAEEATILMTATNDTRRADLSWEA